MANEFVARNGIIAQNNSLVSGSLTVTNGITGSITTASYSDFAVNATNASTASSADNFLVRNTLTAQTLVVSTVSSSVVYSSGSNIFGNNLSNTQQLTGSVSITGSLTVNNVDLLASSASFSTRTTNLESTSSVLTSASASFAVVSGSYSSMSGSTSTRVTSLENASGSFSTRITNTEATASSLTLASGSFSTRITNEEATGSRLVTASGSFSTRVTNTEVTASSLVAASASFVANYIKSSQTSSMTVLSSSFASTVGSVANNITNNTDNYVLTSTGGGSINGESLLQFDGQKLSILYQSGDEGGELLLNKAATNTTLTGSGVTVDIYQNRFRIFEQGGNARGFYLDITAGGGGASTNLLGGGGTVTSVSASGTVSGLTLGGGPITGAGTITLSGTISGLTNSNLSGNAGITNANLANPSLMIGTTGIALGATGSTLAGLTSVTSTTFLGSLTGTASFANNATTSSYASNAELLDGLDNTSFVYTSSFNTFSSSYSTRLTNEEATGSRLVTASGSFSTRVTNTEATASNIVPRVVLLEATASNLITTSGSFSTRTTNLEATASSLTTITTNLTNASASFSTRVTSNESSITSLTNASASFSTRVTSNESSITSLTNASGSASTRLTNLETASGSFSSRITTAEGSVSSLNNKTGSFATTGSNTFTGTQTVQGTIIAQTLNVQQVTSSIVYSSGSNIFGKLTSDVQQFTGSLRVNGSGEHWIMGGNVGIGTTIPFTIADINLSVNGAGSSAVQLGVGGTRTGQLYASSTEVRLSTVTNIPLRFYTNDGESMRITGGGNVGVGTTSPSYLLHVNGGDVGTSGFFNARYNSSNETYKGTFGWNHIQLGNNGNNDIIAGRTATGGYLRFIVNNTGSYSYSAYDGILAMTILSNGNVGIGTSSPSTNLHIVGDTYITDELGVGVAIASKRTNYGAEFRANGASAQIFFGRDGGSGGSGAIGADASNALNVYNSSSFTQIMVVTQNGDVGIGTTSPGAKFEILDTSGQKLQIDGNEIYHVDDSPFYIKSSGDIIFQPNSTTQVIINESGNVGIGTTSPSQRLDVNGNILTNSVLYAGSVSSTRITVDGGSIQGYFSSEANARFLIGRDIYTSGQSGIALGGGGSFVMIGDASVTSGTAMAFAVGASSGGGPSAEKMRINSSGNVGIGITSPSVKLDISGSIRSEIESDGNFITLQSTGQRIHYIKRSGQILQFTSDGANAYNVQFDSSNRSVYFVTGSVGIGTTSPDVRLDVLGTSDTTDVVRIRKSSTGSRRGALGMQSGVGYLDLYNDSSALSIRLFAAGNSYFNGGNVGIGTTSMDTLLHVFNGSAGTISSYESTGITIENSGRASLQLLSPVANDAYVFFGSPNSANAGYVGYENTANRLVARSSGYISLVDGTGEIIRITGGNVGIGTTSPPVKFQLIGDGAIFYSGSGQASYSAGLKFRNDGYEHWTIGAKGSSFVIAGTGANGNTVWAGGSTTDRVTISSAGAVKLNNYGSGTNTGTVAYNLAVDSSGNVIETAGGVVDGSGTANYVPRWQDANTLTNSVIYDNGTNIGIGTTSNLTAKINFPASDYGEGINFYTSATTSNRTGIGKYVSEFRSYVPSADYFTWYSGGPAGSEIMRVSGGGNVGIGTTSPSRTLDVNGEIRTRTGTIDFSNDFNNQIYVLSNTMTFKTNGSDKMVIASGGNVGIGTTSPGYKLDVNGEIGLPGTIRLTNGGGTITYISEAYGINLNGDATHPIQINATLLVGYNASGGSYGTNNAYIAGNVGIGTTSPGEKLTINGSLGLQLSGTQTWHIAPSSGNNLEFVRSGIATRMIITSDGNVGIGTTSFGTSKLSVDGNIGFAGDTTKYFYMPDVNQGTGSIYMQAGFGSSQAGGALRLYGHNATAYTGGDVEVGLSGKGNFLINSTIGGSRLVTVNISGNVGIGTTSPSTKLHVVGTSTFTDEAYFTDKLGVGITSLTYKAEVAGAIGQYWTGTAFTGTPLALAISNTQAGGYDPVLLYRQTDSGGTTKLAGSIGLVGTAAWTAGNNASQTSDMYFLVRNASGGISERMRIKSDGNVGIGTTSPAFKLETIGNTRISGNLSVGTTYNGFAANIEGVVYVINGSVWVNDGYGYANASATNTGMFPDSGNNITFKTNNSTRIYVTSGGNVGIGSTSPQNTFVVNGSQRSYNGSSYEVVKHGTFSLNDGTAGNFNHFITVGTTNVYATSIELTLSEENIGHSVIKYTIVTNYDDLNSTTKRIVLPLYSTNPRFESLGGSYGGAVHELQMWSDGSGTMYLRLVVKTIGGNSTPNWYWTAKLKNCDITDTPNSTGTDNTAYGIYRHTQITQRNSNVGIGTTNPAYKLDVAGTLRTTGNVILADSSNVIIRNHSNYPWFEGQGASAQIFFGRNGQNPWGIGSDGTYAFRLWDSSFSSGYFSILTNGNVGIGTTSPSSKLHVSSGRITITAASSGQYDLIRLENNTSAANGAIGVNSSGFMYLSNTTGGTQHFVLDSNGNVGIGTTSPTYKLDVDGTIRATGDVIAYSDARVKDNVQTVENALSTITSLRGVTYTRKDSEDKSRKVGVIAQEVLPILPEVVQKDTNGNYSVAYGNIVGVLIEAIKELKAEIDILKNK